MSVIECAGGAAIDHSKGSRILDKVLNYYDERPCLTGVIDDEVGLVKMKLLSDP